MCMKSSRISIEEIKRYSDPLKATMVDRRNPENPVKPLMKAVEAKNILHAGSSVDMLKATGLTKASLLSHHNIQPIEPREVTIQAEWKNKDQEQAKSGCDASVFGGLGVLLVAPNDKALTIPTMNALAVPTSFLKKYNAELIPVEKSIDLEPALDESLETLYLIEYEFGKEYVEQYALKMKGGGGLFVETHPFPQIFTPLSPDCSGGLILGINKGHNEYSFAAFQIPFGYTMKINSMAIHGDSFFVGSYAIALTDTKLADSVLFRKNTPDRDIQQVKQVMVKPAKPPFMAEYRLFKEASRNMLLEKLHHDAAPRAKAPLLLTYK